MAHGYKNMRAARISFIDSTELEGMIKPEGWVS